MKPSTHGGKRAGAGRKRGAPTSTLSFRVSADHKARFAAKVAPNLRRQWLEARIDADK